MAVTATAVWDNTTPVDSFLFQNVEDTGAAMVSINITGSITAGTIIFEASDDGNHWYSLPGLVQSTFAIFTTWQPSFGSSVSLQFCVSGFSQFRLRLNPIL